MPDNIHVFTAPVSMPFCHLFTPQVYDEKTNKFREPLAGEDGWYDASFLFDAASPDLAAIKAIAKRIVDEARFTDRNGQLYAPSELQVPWEAGDAYVRRQKSKRGARADDYDYSMFEGSVILKANSKYPPLLNLFQNGTLTKYRDPMRGSAEPYFYQGVRVLAEVNIVKHQVGSNKPGVKCYLNELVSTNTGDRIAGGKPTEDKFSEYVGSVSNVAPSGGAAAQPW